LRHLAGIYKEGLRECIRNVSQDTQSLGEDINRGLHEYDAGFYPHDREVQSEISV
jgi:hypothetical protein